MYVTNDSVSTRFETMSNKELGSFIRGELKKIGINATIKRPITPIKTM